MNPSLKLAVAAIVAAAATQVASAAPVTWETITGGGTDIGVGADGTVWLLGENSWLENKPIFRRDGDLWTPIFGKAMSVAVDPDGNAWVANLSGEIFRHDGNTWVVMPGKAMDIGIGADGTVWIIGYKSWPASWDVPPDNVEVYRWNAGTSVWDKVDGSGVRIAVDPTGRPWIVNRSGEIYRRKANNTTAGIDQWEKMPGTGSDIGIGADGTVWLVESGLWVDNHDIFVWNGSDWSATGGSGMRISAGPDGTPWMVNVDGDIYKGHFFTLSAADVTAVEGGNATFQVKLSEPHTQEVRVDYTTVDGTALANVDYVPAGGTLVFPAGTTNQTVQVAVSSDGLVEGTETFGLKLVNPVNAFVRTAQAKATVSDMATLSILDAGASEGDTINFEVRRSGATNTTITATVSTASGTAESGKDFAGASATLSFARGETNKFFTVVTFPDANAEATETFTATITEVIGGAIARATATGSITNAGSVVNPSDILTFSATDRSLTIKTVAGQNYVLEYTDVLGAPSQWKTSQAFTGSGTPVTIFLVDVPVARRFYRVRVNTP